MSYDPNTNSILVVEGSYEELKLVEKFLVNHGFEKDDWTVSPEEESINIQIGASTRTFFFSKNEVEDMFWSVEAMDFHTIIKVLDYKPIFEDWNTSYGG